MASWIDFKEDFRASSRDIDVSVFGFGKVKDFAKDKGLLKKDEFHITLIPRAVIEKIHGFISGLSEEKRNEYLDKIGSFLKKFDWNFSVRPEIYYVSKNYEEKLDESGNPEKRESIIQLVDLPDLVGFYEELGNSLSVDFEMPLPHVTLFANSTIEDNKLRGIGIDSWEHFWSLNPVRIV
ncbi:MAG: hypothetical protein ABEI74_04925 [Candidatus Pacearchaeota archaeon]